MRRHGRAIFHFGGAARGALLTLRAQHTAPPSAFDAQHAAPRAYLGRAHLVYPRVQRVSYSRGCVN